MPSHLRPVAVAVVGSAIGILPGCGSQREALVSINISPATATATHGSANDKVQFTADGNFGTFGSYKNSTATATCMLHTSDKTKPLSEVNWTTSDSVNSSIDTTGVATCTGTTALPATITAEASGICGGIKTTATLSCN